MSVLDGLKRWFRKRTTNPTAEGLRVTWDDERVLVTATPSMEENWNQEFRWADVTRVCFKDAGIQFSDILFVFVQGREEPHLVLTEAESGSAFFAQLVERKLFPRDLFAKAIGSTSGEMHCWPPEIRPSDG